MAESTTTAEVPKRTIKVKNTNPAGQRWVYDASGKQHLLGPGEEAEVEVAEPMAKQLEEMSKTGSGLLVEGFDPEPQERPEGAPEVPEEHESRTALAAKEAELMEAGQESDKERRERDAKKSGPQLAAETGIHMYARGDKPQVVAMPPDYVPPKKPK